MTVTRRVTVERNRLRFAAAHMATFGGGCEPLHGHNYDVLIELEGDLTEDSWVWDFGSVKKAARAICDELDHHFLLQRNSKHLHIAELGDAWEVAFRDKRYVFPNDDVYPLPIENTTAECISEWFAGRLLADLRMQGATSLRKLSVGIEEMPGQRVVCGMEVQLIFGPAFSIGGWSSWTGTGDNESVRKEDGSGGAMADQMIVGYPAKPRREFPTAQRSITSRMRSAQAVVVCESCARTHRVTANSGTRRDDGVCGRVQRNSRLGRLPGHILERRIESVR